MYRCAVYCQSSVVLRKYTSALLGSQVFHHDDDLSLHPSTYVHTDAYTEATDLISHIPRWHILPRGAVWTCRSNHPEEGSESALLTGYTSRGIRGTVSVIGFREASEMSGIGEMGGLVEETRPLR